MIIKLGKVTQETKDTGTAVTLFDGSPFPPWLYWRIFSFDETGRR